MSFCSFFFRPLYCQLFFVFWLPLWKLFFLIITSFRNCQFQTSIYLIDVINKMNCELMLTYDTPALRQTGSRNLTGQKRFPRYGVPIWSLWPNIRSLPLIVAEKNVTKNVHICSLCIKTNYVRKQEVGIWRVQKRYPQYGIPIWCLWPNIRFLPSTVTEKNAPKNILDGRTEVKQYTPSPFGERGYNNNNTTICTIPDQRMCFSTFCQPM